MQRITDPARRGRAALPEADGHRADGHRADTVDAVGLVVLALAAPALLIGAAALLEPGEGAASSELVRLLGLGAGIAGLGLVAWWAVGLLGLVLATVGRRTGRLGFARLGARLTPALLGRVAGAVLGAHMLAAPAAWAEQPAVGPVPDAGQTVSHAAPASTTASAPAAVPEAAWTPRTPVPAPPGASAARDLSDRPTVTVRRGDCLWDIAAAELGPDATPREIDARWRRWHEANRRVIGDDPHLLLPGTVLTAPVFSPHAAPQEGRP